MNVIIRQLEMNDINFLVPLFSDLGYPTTTEELYERFERINLHHDYYSLVAIYNNEVVGFSGLCKMLFFEQNGAYARILAFVVSSKYQHKGIGKVLLKASEDWASEQDCMAVILNSGNRDERKVAHKFYLNNGYQIKSSGFSKLL